MYRVEVIADNGGKFCGNALAFDTVDEAVEYAQDLMMRWTLVQRWRIVCVPSGEVVAQKGFKLAS